MRVVSVPVGLLLSALSILVFLPLAVAQTYLLWGGPWIRMPYERLLTGLGPVLIVVPPLILLALRGRRLSGILVAVCGGAWVLFSALAAIRVRETSPAFFTLLLALICLGVVSWLRLELGRSFFDPDIRWYQGLPKPIPGLICEILSDSGREEFRVSRLDREGAFLFRASPDGEEGDRPGWMRAGESQRLVFRFRDREVSCLGRPIRTFRNPGAGIGVGLQFAGPSPDARKSLGDFVEMLKGEGYVA